MKWLGRLCSCGIKSRTSKTPNTFGNITDIAAPDDLSSDRMTSVLQFLTIPSKYDTPSDANTDAESHQDLSESHECENEEISTQLSTSNVVSTSPSETLHTLDSSFCQNKNKELLKLLFLDIDGVLCLRGQIISPQHLNRIVKIVKKTQCKIVLSSAWRLRSDLKQMLFDAFARMMEHEENNNLGNNNNKKVPVNIYDYIIGQTPDFKRLCPRALEIMAFVDSVKTFPNYQLHHWVAVDDSNLYAPCGPAELKQHIKNHFVQCNPELGITEDIVDTIVAKLNNDTNECHLCHQKTKTVVKK